MFPADSRIQLPFTIVTKYDIVHSLIWRPMMHAWHCMYCCCSSVILVIQGHLFTPFQLYFFMFVQYFYCVAPAGIQFRIIVNEKNLGLYLVNEHVRDFEWWSRNCASADLHVSHLDIVRSRTEYVWFRHGSKIKGCWSDIVVLLNILSISSRPRETTIFWLIWNILLTQHSMLLDLFTRSQWENARGVE